MSRTNPSGLIQVNAILGFKNLEEEDKENCPCGDELRGLLQDFHDELMLKLTLKALQDASGV